MKYFYQISLANISVYFCVQINPVAVSAWLAITIQVFIIYHAIFNYFKDHNKK